jgi:hypothetical protein
VEPLTLLNSNGWFSALPANIRLGWIKLTMANALTYYDTAENTAVKSFIYAPVAWLVEQL